jgi:hypothetical protein
MPLPNATLAEIQTKVRRITRSPSTSQLSDTDLNKYINTFLVYNLPDQLRLFSLRTILTWYTQPYVDEYETNVINPNDPLYDFKNKYLAIHQPIYLAGIQGFYTQQRDIFYGYYPQTNTIADTQLRGTGGNGPFGGTVTAHPMLQRSVIFTCNNVAGSSMILIDNPIVGNNQFGNLIAPNNPATVWGTINYVTGVFLFFLPAPTQVGATIWVENIAYQPGKPLAMLFYDEKFIIRPVPDKVYQVQIEADITPTELINTTDNPFLKRAWEYIAFQTSKKIFEDRLDYDSINLIMPSIIEHENLLLRSTLTQQANERPPTIYTQGKNYGFGWFGPGGWPY